MKSLTVHLTRGVGVFLCFGVLSHCKLMTPRSTLADDVTTNIDVNIIANPSAFIPNELKNWNLVEEQSPAPGQVVKVFMRIAGATVTVNGLCYEAEFYAIGGGSSSEGQQVTAKVSASGGGTVEVQGVLGTLLCFDSRDKMSPLSIANIRWIQSPTITKAYSWGGSTNRARRWRVIPRLVARIAGNVARQQAAAQVASNAAQAQAMMTQQLPTELSATLKGQLAEYQAEAREFVQLIESYLGGNFQIYRDPSSRLMIVRVIGKVDESLPPRINTDAVKRHVVLQVSEEWLSAKIAELNPTEPGKIYSLAELISIQKKLEENIPAVSTSEVVEVTPDKQAQIEQEREAAENDPQRQFLTAAQAHIRLEFPGLADGRAFDLQVAANVCQAKFPLRVHVDFGGLGNMLFGTSFSENIVPVSLMDVSVCVRKQDGATIAIEVKVEKSGEEDWAKTLLSNVPGTQGKFLAGLFVSSVEDAISHQIEQRLQQLIPAHLDAPRFSAGSTTLGAQQLIISEDFVTFVYQEGPPVIGISYKRVVSTGGEFFKILTVSANSKAQRAGLRAGDFLEVLGDRKARDIADLPAFIISKINGDDKTLPVVFQRYHSQTKQFGVLNTEISLD